MPIACVGATLPIATSRYVNDLPRLRVELRSLPPPLPANKTKESHCAFCRRELRDWASEEHGSFCSAFCSHQYTEDNRVVTMSSKKSGDHVRGTRVDLLPSLLL